MPDLAKSFIGKALTKKAEDRATVVELLQHPFVTMHVVGGSNKDEGNGKSLAKSLPHLNLVDSATSWRP